MQGVSSLLDGYVICMKEVWHKSTWQAINPKCNQLLISNMSLHQSHFPTLPQAPHLRLVQWVFRQWHMEWLVWWSRTTRSEKHDPTGVCWTNMRTRTKRTRGTDNPDAFIRLNTECDRIRLNMWIVRVAHFSLITHVWDSCVLSIEVALLLQSNSEEIERISFVQQSHPTCWGEILTWSCHKVTYYLWKVTDLCPNDIITLIDVLQSLLFWCWIFSLLAQYQASSGHHIGNYIVLDESSTIQVMEPIAVAPQPRPTPWLL
jgi:hypothetical protein